MTKLTGALCGYNQITTLTVRFEFTLLNLFQYKILLPYNLFSDDFMGSIQCHCQRFQGNPFDVF